MRVAVYAPHPTANIRIKHNPIRGVYPSFGHSGSGADPGFPRIFAAEEPNVGVRDELTPDVERIEMDSVVCSDVKPCAGPASIWHLARVHGTPRPSIVGRFH